MRGIKLTDQDIKEAQELWRTAFGIELTEDEARREASELLEVVLIALGLD